MKSLLNSKDSLTPYLLLPVKTALKENAFCKASHTVNSEYEKCGDNLKKRIERMKKKKIRFPET